MEKRVRVKKSNSRGQDIVSKIYDPSHKWKYDIWQLKLLAFFFNFANFHWFNEHPLLKMDSITITESLFLLYTLLLFILFKNIPSPKAQILNLALDFLFIAFFDYLSLSSFGYNSRAFALYFIPVIYCSYWFIWSFTLIFVTLVSIVYTIVNYFTPDMGIFYTTGEKFGKLLPVIAILYLCALVVILYKKKIQKDFIEADEELKKRAEKLEQAKESTQTLLKDTIDGFIVIDEYGKITETNQLARELLGYDENEIYNTNVKQIYAPGEAKKIMQSLLKSPDGTIYDFKTWIQSKENEKIPIHLSASFLYDRATKLKKVLKKEKRLPSLGHFRDIRAEDIFDKITKEIASIMNEQVLLDKIVKKVAATIHSETCSVFIYNEQRGLIEIISSFGIPEQLRGKKEMESYAENESMTGNVFSSGETLNISDIDVKKEQSKDANIKWKYVKRFASHSRFGDLKHFLGTPLRIQDEVYGVIRVINKYRTADNELDKHGFTDKDILLLERISNQVSILLEKVRNKERFEAISKVGIELNAKVDLKLDNILGIIARGVVEGMKFKSCSLRLIEDNNKLRVKACYGLKGKYKEERFTLKVGSSISGKVAKTGIFRVAVDLRKETDFKFKELLNEGLTSMLSIPLKHHNKIIGVINCYTGKKHHFTDEEIRIMETFAVYAAVAIQNKKRMDELLALNKIGQELLKPFQPEKLKPFGSEKLLDTILQQAKAISGADSLCIKIYDKISREISTVRALECEWYEKTKDFKSMLSKNDLSEGVKSGKPIIIKNFDVKKSTVKNVPNIGLLKKIKSRIILPFEIYGKISGELCLESFRKNFFTEDISLLLSTFTTQVTTALRNAHYLSKLQLVSETFPKISELDVDIDKVLNSIVEIAAETLETDILVLFLYDAKHKEIKRSPILYGDIKYREFIESEDFSPDKPLSIIKTGTSYYATNSQEDSIMSPKSNPLRKGVPDQFVVKEGITSSAGIVLKVAQEIVGIMFINYRTPHDFNIDERQIIEIFASYIAIAIQNVMHFNQKKAADILNSIGKLAGNFAHKVKTDIGTITLYTSDLIDEIKPETPQYFHLKQIKEKLFKITTDIDFLSNISKVYIHKKKIINVNDLIKVVQSEILPDFKMKKIKFEIKIDPELPEIEIDPTQIKMVFINLAQNSIDAMPGGGRILLSISKSGNSILFDWTDTGCGIPQKNAHKIFDFLWSTKGKGSGLGLFYAETIIEEHDGTISLDTDYKGGARFVFTLPTKKSSDSEA
jgi:PAS domain S-box-containing protein